MRWLATGVLSASFGFLAVSTEAQEMDTRFVSKAINGSEQPELIPDAAAIHMFSEMIVAWTQQKEQAGLDFLRDSLRLGSREFSVLHEIAEESLARAKSEQEDSMRLLCRDDSFVGLYSDRRNLGRITRELNLLSDALSGSRESFFKEELARSLGNLSSAEILAWIDINIKPAVKIVEFDTESISAEAGMDPGKVFQENCRHLSTKASSKDAAPFGNTITEE